METLSWSGPERDRIVSMPLDRELDLYRTLAYLQLVDARYREKKLYPHLDDLRFRLDQLTELRKQKEELLAGMPRDVIGVDLRTGELMRAAAGEDDLLRTIDVMIDQALPELKNAMERGTDLRGRLTRGIHLDPVGVLPLVVNEGYLLLRQGSDAVVYSYSCPRLRITGPPLLHRFLRTRYVATYSVGISFTYENVKADLAHRFASLPVPAMFAFESDITLPRIETFMPLAKQAVYEFIAVRSDQ